MLETISIENAESPEPEPLSVFNNVVETISESASNEVKHALDILQHNVTNNPELLKGLYFDNNGFVTYLAFPNEEYTKDRFELTVLRVLYNQEVEYMRIVSRLDPKFQEEEDFREWIVRGIIPRYPLNVNQHIANLLVIESTYKEISKVAKMKQL